MHVIMVQLYEEFGRISNKYDFSTFVDDMTEYAEKKMQDLVVEKHEFLGHKTQKQHKTTTLPKSSRTRQRLAKSRQRQAQKKDMVYLQNDVINIDGKIK